MAGQWRTTVDLVTEVLANLGVLSAGQPTDVEDYQYVAEKLDAIFRLLAGLEIVYIADANNIPGVYFSPLADIVAGETATKFGVTAQDLDMLISKGLGKPPGTGAAALALKQITRGRPTYETLQADFF
jgi:hypothetical protein